MPDLRLVALFVVVTVTSFGAHAADPKPRPRARTPAGYLRVDAQRFEMGDDALRHRVEITRPYWLKKTEVTQAEWDATVGPNRAYNAGCPDCPVENLSKADAIRYLNRLSEAEGLEVCYDGERFVGLDCEGYRLPTDAEWELAARAGSRRDLDVDAVGWHKGNSGGSTHPVGRKQANDWGFFDMLGNVLEWTQDEDSGEYEKAAATNAVQVDPLYLGSTIAHISRGGAFDDPPAKLAKYRRSISMPTSRLRWNGLRPARTIR